jgi:hypothetical protein
VPARTPGELPVDQELLIPAPVALQIGLPPGRSGWSPTCRVASRPSAGRSRASPGGVSRDLPVHEVSTAAAHGRRLISRARRYRRELGQTGMPLKAPELTLCQIRQEANEVLPAGRVSRLLLWRYGERRLDQRLTVLWRSRLHEVISENRT